MPAFPRRPASLRKKVGLVFDALVDEISKALSKKGAGAFTLPAFARSWSSTSRPASQEECPEPVQAGEMMDVAAKPAKNVVKVRALKKLKDMV